MTHDPKIAYGNGIVRISNGLESKIVKITGPCGIGDESHWLGDIIFSGTNEECIEEMTKILCLEVK